MINNSAWEPRPTFISDFLICFHKWNVPLPACGHVWKPRHKPLQAVPQELFSCFYLWLKITKISDADVINSRLGIGRYWGECWVWIRPSLVKRQIVRFFRAFASNVKVKMAATLLGVLEGNCRENVLSARILVVGAGGIGCELLKNLVLTGFKDIEVVRMWYVINQQ